MDLNDPLTTVYSGRRTGLNDWMSDNRPFLVIGPVTSHLAGQFLEVNVDIGYLELRVSLTG